MSDREGAELGRTLRFYEATLRAIAERAEEPGSALIARNALARIETHVKKEHAR